MILKCPLSSILATPLKIGSGKGVQSVAASTFDGKSFKALNSE